MAKLFSLHPHRKKNIDTDTDINRRHLKHIAAITGMNFSVDIRLKKSLQL